MDVRCLKGLDSLTRLLETDERDTPGMILVGSTTCPLSLELQANIRARAPALPQFVFYELNIDDYSAPGQDLAVTRLLSEWQADGLPAQILLPSNRPPVAINKTSLGEICKALKDLY
ncbi:hypothetical protein [Pseudomonas putida]|uniref:Uncharacterized protein n=1 Tax=Pseudomonas putida TaxID=303 RepID=A0A1Q9QVX6_PSEPU|nr:hypothetical protein [Pseudomonas putida]OLS59295.1 hypothetical protein PSEMO_58050 [Pseudomonas putida]